MKRNVLLLVLAAQVALATVAIAENLKLAVTTSFQNSGLADVLLPAIHDDIGLDVQLLVVGTGQALRLGASGDVDAVLVHARAAEDAFVAAGHATHRREIMYNDFVLIGPKSDPANISHSMSATEALRLISQSGWPFVSRGDDSGTHKKELSLWGLAGMDAANFEASWYKAAGAGMGATLNIASGMNAYVMADRASWLNFGNKGDLAILYSGDPKLFNQYAYLPVNPAKHRHIKAAAAAALEAWLVSPRAEALINGYRLNGEQLFTFNAQR